MGGGQRRDRGVLLIGSTETARLGRIRRRLLAWYRRNARDLPWRRDRDAYRVWVSEVMLQQTRVEAARDHYERFIERFPSVDDLAAASEDEVLACWSGLGYYRRARDLHRAAREVRDRHGGEFPGDESEARRLPGVGAYTAGAVLSISRGRCLPAVDGNVRRVLARLFGIEGDPARGEASRRIGEFAAVLVRGKEPGDWNQALMELGARVCTPRGPACPGCPLRGDCTAEAEGRQAELPQMPARAGAVRERLAAVALVWRGRVLLSREEQGIVKGLWEVPWVGLGPGTPPAGAAVRAALEDRYAVRAGPLEERGRVGHTVMRRRLEVEVCRAAAREGSRAARCRWLQAARLGELPLSALARKVLDTALGSG